MVILKRFTRKINREKQELRKEDRDKKIRLKVGKYIEKLLVVEIDIFDSEESKRILHEKIEVVD
jgi:hypothetical protein